MNNLLIDVEDWLRVIMSLITEFVGSKLGSISFIVGSMRAFGFIFVIYAAFFINLSMPLFFITFISIFVFYDCVFVVIDGFRVFSD